MTQAEYNLFMSKVLGGFGVRELRDIVDKLVDYELENDRVIKISLENNIEL